MDKAGRRGCSLISCVRRDNDLQCTADEEAGESATRGGATSGGTISVLSRVLISVDKALLSACSLGIGPADDPDIQYLSKVRTTALNVHFIYFPVPRRRVFNVRDVCVRSAVVVALSAFPSFAEKGWVWG